MTKQEQIKMITTSDRKTTQYLRWLLKATEKDQYRKFKEKVFVDFSTPEKVHLVATTGKSLHVLEFTELGFREMFHWQGTENTLVSVIQNKVSGVIFEACREDLTYPNWASVFNQHIGKGETDKEITCKGEAGLSEVIITKVLLNEEMKDGFNWSLAEDLVSNAIGKGTLYRPKDSRESQRWIMRSSSPLEPVVLEEVKTVKTYGAECVKAFAIVMPIRTTR
jgi:hypothetical protein